MRLISTLWTAINLKKFIIWYVIGMVLASLNYFDDARPIAIMAGVAVVHIFLGMILLMAWNKVIHGQTEGFPLLWIWSYVFHEVKVFETDTLLYEMTIWCRENCEGKWIHCEHGYFSFRKKTDLVAFKLRFI